VREGEPQIPRFARDDKKGRLVIGGGRLPKEKAVLGAKGVQPISGLLRQTPSPFTNTLPLHKHPLLSQTPFPCTNTLSLHKHPLLAQTLSLPQTPPAFTKHPLLSQTTLPSSNRPLPTTTPLLFVIPSEARDLRFSFRLAKSALATTLPIASPHTHNQHLLAFPCEANFR
jgi:hypothetical protein